MNTDDVGYGAVFVAGTLATASALGCLGGVVIAGIAAIGAKKWVTTEVPAMSHRVYEHKEEQLWAAYKKCPNTPEGEELGREIKGKLDTLKKMKSKNDEGIERLSNIAAVGTFAYPLAALGMGIAALDSQPERAEVQDKYQAEADRMFEARFGYKP